MDLFVGWGGGGGFRVVRMSSTAVEKSESANDTGVVGVCKTVVIVVCTLYRVGGVTGRLPHALHGRRLYTVDGE